MPEEPDEQARPKPPSLDWYAPNQQAVGTDAVADIVTPYATVEQASAPAEEFDPADYSVEEVKAYVAENPDERSRVLTAEESGKNRSTLTSWLSSGS